MQKNKIRETAVHVLATGLFLLLPIVFAPHPQNLPELDPGTRRELVSSLCMLLFFYAAYFVLIPRYYFRKKYVVFGLWALFFLLLVAVLPPLLFPWHRPGPPPGPPGPPPVPGARPGVGFGFLFFEMGHRFFLFAATLLFSLTLKINARWRQSEREKLNAELSYLRAQINPHFLFNTLNSIYSLSIQKSDKTPEAVVKLSGMMRYVLGESHNERVSLEREVAYIGDYIDLQKIRLGDTVKLSYSFTGHMAGRRVAPLVLIPFVENAFKHGVNSEEPSEIWIHIQTDENRLTLEVRNNKVNVTFGQHEKSGLGIENTRNRLNLLYPHRHELIIRNGEREFSVVLKITLA